jgi:methanogenic corrinoid protein MtbC1
MDPQDRAAADALEAISRAVAAWAADAMYDADASMEHRYGSAGKRLWRSEMQSRLNHLVEAMAADRAELFVANAAWSRTAFIAREMAESDLRQSLETLGRTLEEHAPGAVWNRAKPMIALAARRIDAVSPSVAAGDALPTGLEAPEAREARLYLLRLLQRDREGASEVASSALSRGATLAQVYETILMPALAEVGRMWHLQEATIADEHYCTGATQMIMARLRASVPTKPGHGQRVVATAVGGDLHEIGIRMVSDIFDADGWEVEFLGANMPTEDLVDAIDPERGGHATHLVAASASTTLAVRAVADMIVAIRSRLGTATVPVLVGGTPFRLVPDLWQVVGADGFALTAADALREGERLVSERARHAQG